ncbi:MAG: histidinol-phosphate transaminase [Cyclobacteriaceae bacterium]|nr:histidinol-phosphate transaminase [Cyclobacteriaceae bacterium SS2]
MVSPENLVRSHLKAIKAYSSARDEYEGEIGVFLDANENALGSVTQTQVNRYPDPHHRKLKAAWSKIKGIDADHIFFGNGSDEPIDLLIRLFCNPEKDHIITMPPTYGMYEVSASINNVENKKIPLTEDFQIDVPAVMAQITPATKMIFVCSPNNPTGNLLNKKDVEEILASFRGIVVIDEAYIDFSSEASWSTELSKYRNLVVLQTLSKAWGMAGIRVGSAMADPYIISMLEKIKPPYNLSLPNQQLAFEAMGNVNQKEEEVKLILAERERVKTKLQDFPQVKKIFPSDANFLLVRFEESKPIFDYLIREQVIVRDRSSQINCSNCLRITIGTKEENDQLLKLIRDFYQA